MQSENQAKIQALKSIMNNPKLSRVLEDGFNSPIGSTKREQAKSVVSILKKLGSPNTSVNRLKEQSEKMMGAKNPYALIYKKAFEPAKRNDGQGGYGDSINPYSSTTPFSTAPVTPSISGPSITKRAPAPSIKFSDPSNTALLPSIGRAVSSGAGKLQELKTAGATGLLKGVLGLGALGEYGMANLPKTFINSNLPGMSFSDTAGSRLMGMIPSKTSPTPTNVTADINKSNNVIDLSKTPGVDVATTLRDSAPGTLINQGKFWRYKDKNGKIYSGTEQQMKDKQKSDGMTTSGATSDSAESLPMDQRLQIEGDSYAYINNNGTVHYGKLGDNYEDKTVAGVVDNVQDQSGADTGATTSGEWNPFTGTDKESSWAGVPESIKKLYKDSLTKDQFAMSLMADKEKLRELFPGIPDEMLPTGASLQGQVDELEKRLREEYKLDQIANERNELIRSGATLSTDLTDYMRGRDTYINSVNGMIDKVKANINGQGLSDPDSQAANNQYLDYLSVLKGRQNKRYIDLLNTSIASHDANMTNITNEYNTTFQNFKDELASGTELTKQRYEQMYSTLTGMYDMVQAGPTMANELAMQRAEINKTNADALKTTMEAMNPGSTTKNSTDFMTEAGKYKETFLDKTTNAFLPNTDLTSLVNTALSSGKSPNSIAYIIETGLKNSYGSSLADVAKGKALIESFKAEGGDETMATYGINDFSSQMLSLLGQSASTAAKNQISSSPDDIKSALEWITDLNPADLDNKKNKFFSKFSNIDSNLLNTIWGYYKNSASDPNNVGLFKDKASRKKVFTFLDKNSDAEAASSALAKQISYYLSNQ